MIKYIFLPGPNAYTPNVVKETPQYRFEEDQVLAFSKVKGLWMIVKYSVLPRVKRSSKSLLLLHQECMRYCEKSHYIWSSHIWFSFFDYCKVITVTDPEEEEYSSEYHPLTLQWILKRIYVVEMSIRWTAFLQSMNMSQHQISIQ